jgi:hypothetical protein
MTLDDALSCGDVIKVVVRDGYYVYDEKSSNLDVHYGLTVKFKNLNGTHASDVGILLENLKREQQWTVETTEKDTGDIGLLFKWHSNFTGDTSKGLELINRESNTGYSALFDEKARIEQGRILDYISEDDKTNITDLSQYDADLLILYLEAKRFQDPKRPGEEVIGILQDGVDPVLSNASGDGISSNSLIAALIKSVQGLTALVKQLYAKRIFEYEYIDEVVIPIVLLIGATTEESEGTENVNYTINHYKFETEESEGTETVIDIETVGRAESIAEDSNLEDKDNEYIQ